jgi:hypothetical protein
VRSFPPSCLLRIPWVKSPLLSHLTDLVAWPWPELAEPLQQDQTHSNEDSHLFPSPQLLPLHLQMVGMLLR